MLPSAFTLLAPDLGALDLSALANHLRQEGEGPFTREMADRRIAAGLKKLGALRADLANAPAATYPPDTEKWNPYPRVDDDDDEPLTPAEAIEERIGEIHEEIGATLRRSGRLPVTLNGADAPTEAQARAIAHFVANARALLGPLSGVVHLDEDEEDEEEKEEEEVPPAEGRLSDLEGGFSFWYATVSRWDDPAFVHVSVRADAAIEHGLLVIVREGDVMRYGSTDDAYQDAAQDPTEIKAWNDRQKDPAYRLYDEACRAAMDKNVKRLETLVAKGVNLNYPDEDAGYSPLWHALNEYHVEGVRFLLESGADPFRREDGKTALGTARGLFTELSWTEKPRGILGRGVALFAKAVAPKDEDGGTVGSKELRALREIIPMLEKRMGLRPTKF